MKKLYFLFVLMGLAAVLMACEDNTPAVAISVGDVCQQEAGTKVAATGYLSLPTYITCTNHRCEISLHNQEEHVFVELAGYDQPTNNQFKLPPDQYTETDLSFVLADGTAGDQTTSVKITGPVRKPSENVCYLEVHAIERP
jgi:hypothetical protein